MRPAALVLLVAAVGCRRSLDPFLTPVAPPTSEADSGPLRRPVEGDASLPPAASTSASAAPAASAAASLALAAPALETVEQLRQRARRELGERTSFALVRERFLMVGAPGWGEGGVKSSAAFSERVLGALLNGRFDRLPAGTLPVYLFGNATSYEAYCQKQYGGACVSVYGFFSPADRRLVMNVGLGIGTLSHELVHPLVEVDFPLAPTWLNEGIASLFEAPLLPREGEIHGAKNWRYPRLQGALGSARERSKVSVEAIFALSDGVFRRDDEDLNYALARYLCQWLDSRQQLWPFYRGWRDGVATDPTGEKAFRAATGQTPAEATAAWLRWVRAL